MLMEIKHQTNVGGNDNKNNSMLTKSDQPKDSKVTTKPSEKDLTKTETTKKTETEKKYMM